MRCSNCRVSIRFEFDGQSRVYVTDVEKKLGFKITYGLCPECSQLLILRSEGRYWEPDDGSEPTALTVTEEHCIFPPAPARIIEDEDIPEHYRKSFNEASEVLQVSPKASAAISRRLLQEILQYRFDIKKPMLSQQIEEFVRRRDAPIYLLDAIDTVRVIGNLAAHPSKDQTTGSVVDVEPGEADWVLDTLEALLEFAFVQPARLTSRKKSLSKKLEAMGRGLTEQRNSMREVSASGKPK